MLSSETELDPPDKFISSARCLLGNIETANSGTLISNSRTYLKCLSVHQNYKSASNVIWFLVCQSEGQREVIKVNNVLNGKKIVIKEKYKMQKATDLHMAQLAA